MGRATKGGVDHCLRLWLGDVFCPLVNSTFSMLARGRANLEAETDSLEAELRMASLGWHMKFLTWRARPYVRKSVNM